MNPYWQPRCKRCGNAYIPRYKHHTYRVTNNKNETVELCYECHKWVHDNPEKAGKEGLYLPFENIDRNI